jgi:hypothetical protein
VQERIINSGVAIVSYTARWRAKPPSFGHYLQIHAGQKFDPNRFMGIRSVSSAA